ncbi:MAG: phosphate acyltransferase PlsX [Firmicutes bacterium]|nr:phosphate acyltransferase PlsX [Bacillota bacterium]MBR6500809.1 phosphate acyltransferase PlsX [Bacillota bacterium]
MRIIIDGMGGDNAPAEIVKGCVEAAKEISHEIWIVGREDDINKELKKYKYNKEQIKVIHAPEVIENCDAPVKAVRSKKESSMVIGLNLIKSGSGDVFISGGNTGALMAGGLFILGRIPGIDRPALASPYPIMGRGMSLLIDAGANAECKPNNLLEFGIMGSIYMEKVFDMEKPRVGLANIGAEETKGTTVVKAAHQMLKTSGLNFVGNVEAREVPYGVCDVIVCDGFVGNTILKLTEGFALNVLGFVKKKFTEGIKSKMGAILLLDKVKEIKGAFDYSNYGGAPILGVKGPVVKIHGSSNANAVKHGILKAIPFAEGKVVQIVEEAVLALEEAESGE